MAAAKTIVLVTGATNGIGLELAAQLMSREAYHVLLGARSPAKANRVFQDLKTRYPTGSAEVVNLDVTNDTHIEEAAASIDSKFGRLDILVNNAAVAAVLPPLRQQMRDAFDTNATGPAVLGDVFSPLLRKSTRSPRIINVSSGAGSIGRTLDPTSGMYKIKQVQYRASKSALNMVTAVQWVELGPDIKVFAYDPGFTVSDLGPYNTAEQGARSAAESVRPLMDVLEGKRDEEAGRFLHNSGVYPW